MKEQLDELLQKHPTLLKMKKHFDDWQLQVGTLGSGNHFIEVCLDENQAVWVMLHSGSRGLGNLIGRYFIDLAKKDMEKWFISLPNKDLAYFPQGTEHFNDYWQAVMWAQEYARVNREEMMRLILEALSHVDLPKFEITGEAISCHHNYVALENHYKSNIYLTRKGAISARTGEWGIIPGSMGTKSYIVKGKGNPESFCSCSHGAGRRMGRKEAKRRFSTEDMITQTQGVECRKDEGVIDEIPAAYKPIDEVMENQNDLVEIVHTLKQVVCIKG
jgi:tRNA-splicing ligase RtcB